MMAGSSWPWALGSGVRAPEDGSRSLPRSISGADSGAHKKTREPSHEAELRGATLPRFYRTTSAVSLPRCSSKPRFGM